MPSSRRSALALAVACLLVAAACSSDSSAGGSDGRSGTTTTTSEAAPATEMAFPRDEWAEADPETLGFDAKELEIAAERADLADSNCLMVVRRGKVVFERYWNDTDEASAQEIFSATKSFTSTLVGLAESDGDLSVDDPASDYIEEWKGTDSEDVTVENLLSNNSGREWSLAIDYSQLINAPDRTAFAVGLGQEYEPGTTWAYNNSAIQTLERVVSEATQTDMADFATERLFGPLGMDDSVMTRDGSGHAAAFFGIQSTCPDMARFGHLFLNNGMWDGEQILPASWVEAATGHPSQELTAAYGYLWWLNREGVLVDVTQALEPDDVSSSEVGQLAPGAPEDMYAAQGLGGQEVLVDPGSETIVVRLGPAAPRSPTSYGFAEAAEVITTALVDP